MAFVAIAAAYPTPQLLTRCEDSCVARLRLILICYVALARREVLASNLDGYLTIRALGSPDPLTLLTVALNSDSDSPDVDSPDKREELDSKSFNSPKERAELDNAYTTLPGPGTPDAPNTRDIGLPDQNSASSPGSPGVPNSHDVGSLDKRGKLGSNSPGIFDSLSNRDISHPSSPSSPDSPSSPSSPSSPDSPNSPELPNSPNSPDSPDNSPDNLDLPSKRGELDSNGSGTPSVEPSF
jgi:hypothetical protein